MSVLQAPQTIAIPMQLVPILREVMIALARVASTVMEETALTLTSAWIILVMLTPPAVTPLEVILVLVTVATLEMVSTALILTNVRQILVMPMQLAWIYLEVILALVTVAILEMASTAQI
jgi:hypothetical protein